MRTARVVDDVHGCWVYRYVSTSVRSGEPDIVKECILDITLPPTSSSALLSAFASTIVPDDHARGRRPLEFLRGLRRYSPSLRNYAMFRG